MIGEIREQPAGAVLVTTRTAARASWTCSSAIRCPGFVDASTMPTPSRLKSNSACWPATSFLNPFLRAKLGAWPKPAMKCPSGFYVAAACSLSVAAHTPPMHSTFRSNSSIR